MQTTFDKINAKGKKITLFIFYFSCLSVYAQQWDWASKTTLTWTEQYAQKICADNFGNVYVIGTNYSGNSSNWFVVKYNSIGGLLWTNSINGTARDITTDGFGNLYLL